MIKKSIDDWLSGIGCVLMGLFMLKSCGNITSKETDYIKVEGDITEVKLIDPSSRRARDYYCFKIDNPLYKNKWFSNRELYDMYSNVHYKILLQPKKHVKFHVLKKDIWKNRNTLKIFSLYLDHRDVVPFGNQWMLKLRALGIGMFILGGGCLLLFTKD